MRLRWINADQLLVTLGFDPFIIDEETSVDFHRESVWNLDTGNCRTDVSHAAHFESSIDSNCRLCLK